MSRKEKRIARQQEKSEEFEQKRTAQVATILTKKIPGQAEYPENKKAPCSGTPSSRNGVRMTWATDGEDRVDAWSWGEHRDWYLTVGQEFIDAFLRSCSQKTWSELEIETAGDDTRNKTYPLDALCKEARDRLEALEKDDRDVIFRFRMSNLERLYGFIENSVFKTLWYDRIHKVCPSDLQSRGKVRR